MYLLLIVIVLSPFSGSLEYEEIANCVAVCFLYSFIYLLFCYNLFLLTCANFAARIHSEIKAYAQRLPAGKWDELELKDYNRLTRQKYLR